MPAILAFLAALTSTSVLYPLIARVLVGLGVTAVTYAGVSALVGVIETKIGVGLTGLGAAGLAIFHLAKIDAAMSVLMSAYVARLTLSGLTGAGVLRRLQFTGPVAGSGG